MNTSTDTELGERSAGTAVERPRAGARLRRAGEDMLVWMHHQAERMDLVPAEFGQEAQLDETDAGSLLREWLRQARLWAAYNPEEMLALKAGAVALGVSLAVLIGLVAAIR